jgi:hypothetical protein
VDLLINLPHFLQLLASEQKLYVCLAHGKIRVSICDFEAFGLGYALKKKKKEKERKAERTAGGLEGSHPGSEKV